MNTIKTLAIASAVTMTAGTASAASLFNSHICGWFDNCESTSQPTSIVEQPTLVVEDAPESNQEEFKSLFSSPFAGKFSFLTDENPVEEEKPEIELTEIDEKIPEVSEVPLPAAGFLLIGGLGGVLALKRRKS